MDGVPLYRDGMHLSLGGAPLIGARSNLASDLLRNAH